MDQNLISIVHVYGADTAGALAMLLAGDKDGAISVLEGLLSLVRSLPIGGQPSDETQPNQCMQPEQGELQDDGSFWTIQAWYIDAGYGVPTGPDGSSVPSDFIFAPNAPDQNSPDWGTAEWVWRPALA